MAYDASLGAEEKMGSLFQPDTLVPTQYFETFRGKAHLEPEKSFMLAILEYAVASFQKYIFARDSKGKAIFHETEDWILEKNREERHVLDRPWQIGKAAQEIGKL